VEGGNDLQLWKVVVNTLNKQPRTGDKGWFSFHKKLGCYENYEKASNFDGFFG
jgi:hypothetical protein